MEFNIYGDKDQTNDTTFGSIVSELRYSLKLTQEQFGKILDFSKMNVIQIEKVISVSDLSNDILFGLYYLTTKLKQLYCLNDNAQYYGNLIYDIVDHYLSEKMKQKFEIFSNSKNNDAINHETLKKIGKKMSEYHPDSNLLDQFSNYTLDSFGSELEELEIEDFYQSEDINKESILVKKINE